MSRIHVVFYQEDDGTVPLLNWMDRLPKKAVVKCRARIERLRELGHELRRPDADYLRDDIYELRASLGGIHYRMLYFFHGRTAVVISHGLTKERRVPPREIEQAIIYKTIFETSPERHTYEA